MIYWIIFMALLTISLWIVTYHFALKEAGREKRCTEVVNGKIRRYSMIRSAGVKVPLVNYRINGKTYQVRGPVFASARIDVSDKTETNLKSREFLPKNAEVTVKEKKEPVLETLYPIGSKDVQVHYNPENPKEAYVERYCETEPIIKLTLLFLSVVYPLICIAHIILALR